MFGGTQKSGDDHDCCHGIVDCAGDVLRDWVMRLLSDGRIVGPNILPWMFAIVHDVVVDFGGGRLWICVKTCAILQVPTLQHLQ